MGDEKVTVTIKVDADLLAQVTELLKPYGLTPEDLVIKFLEYCGDPKTSNHAIELLKKWKEEFASESEVDADGKQGLLL